ncbi:MAG: hypothetical protein OQL19_07965 [Gammaproteobacteria bacterium]|nr:hypothetical protein [Gammaproteobacteria bacterium]
MTPLPLHGVLFEFNGVGTYLIGASGLGKSEVALQLIHQGARLVCDDAPEFKKNTKNKKLSGHCPEGFFGLMHIHDLGVINILELFGSSSFKPEYTVDFIIELIADEDRLKIISQQTPQQLLTPNYQTWQYRDWTIPGIQIHLYPNRNVPLLIKTAIMQFSTKAKMGVNTSEEIK